MLFSNHNGRAVIFREGMSLGKNTLEQLCVCVCECVLGFSFNFIDLSKTHTSNSPYEIVPWISLITKFCDVWCCLRVLVCPSFYFIFQQLNPRKNNNIELKAKPRVHPMKNVFDELFLITKLCCDASLGPCKVEAVGHHRNRWNHQLWVVKSILSVTWGWEVGESFLHRKRGTAVEMGCDGWWLGGTRIPGTGIFTFTI